MKLTIDITPEQAADLATYLKRLSFDDYLSKTEPHKGREVCTEDAYRMRDALNLVEDAVADARGFKPR